MIERPNQWFNEKKNIMVSKVGIGIERIEKRRKRINKTRLALHGSVINILPPFPILSEHLRLRKTLKLSGWKVTGCITNWRVKTKGLGKTARQLRALAEYPWRLSSNLQHISQKSSMVAYMFIIPGLWSMLVESGEMLGLAEGQTSLKFRDCLQEIGGVW